MLIPAISQRELQKFTNILFKKYTRIRTDAFFAKMIPDDYRLAIEYYEELTGKVLFTETKLWIKLSVDSYWQDVVNDLNEGAYDIIREVINTNGIDIQNTIVKITGKKKMNLDVRTTQLF